MANAVILKASNTTAVSSGASWTGGVAPTSTDVGRYSLAAANTSDIGNASLNVGALHSSTAQTGLVNITGTGTGTLVLNGLATTVGGLAQGTGWYVDFASTPANAFAINCKTTVNNSQTWFIGAGLQAFLGSQTAININVPVGNKVTFTGTGATFSYRSMTNWLGPIDLVDGLLVGSTGTVTSNPFGTGTLTINALGTGTNVGLSPSSAATSGVITFNNPVVVAGNFALSTQGGATFTGGVTLAGPITLNLTPTVTVASGTSTFSGAISGAFGLTKAGAGTLVLSNANTFTGVVSSTAGTINVANANALQDALYQPGAGGTVTWSQASRIGGLTGSGTLSGSVTTWTLGGVNTAVSATFTGTLSHTGNLPIVMNGKDETAVQTMGGTSPNRYGTLETTTITQGAIKLTSLGGLYSDPAAHTINAKTTVNQGGGLWFESFSGEPYLGAIDLNGTGANLTGALRNTVSGGNVTLPSKTITTVTSSTIQSDGGVLTLPALTLGSSSTLTLTTTGSGGITLGNTLSGSGTSKVLVSGGSTVKAGSTTIVSGSTVPTWEIDGAFDANNYAQTVAATKTLQVDGTWAAATTLTTIAGTLDGTGSMTGLGGVSVSSGGVLKAGSGTATVGGNQLSIAGALTLSGGSAVTMPGGAGLTLSKAAVTGALTLPSGNVTVNATGSSWTSGTTHRFLEYGSLGAGSGAFIAGTLTGGTPRQGIGNIQNLPVGSPTYSTFDVTAASITTTWNGGDAGNWYNGQATGWSGTGSGAGATDFVDGDTVTFGSNTTTATLTSNVTVAAMNMNTADHTVGGAFTLTNTGALSVSGAFTQTLNCAGEHGAVGIAAGSTLALGNVNALGSGTGAITLTGSAARLTFNTGLSTARSMTLTPGGAVAQYLTTSSASVVATLSGDITSGLSTASLNKTGSGAVSLTGTNTYASFTRIGFTAETQGENVLRVTPSALGSANLRLNAGSVLEIDNGASNYNFTRTYGTGAGQFYTENLVADAGGGFSSRGTGGVTVTQNITFGTTTPGSNWIGPMYFGTALGTSQGRVTMSGVLNVTALTASSAAIFYVYGDAQINKLTNTSSTYSCSVWLYGNGNLYIADQGTTGAGGPATVQPYDNVSLEIGPNTLNAVGRFIIQNGNLGASNFKQVAGSSVTCPAVYNASTSQVPYSYEATDPNNVFTLAFLQASNATLKGSGVGIVYEGTGSGNVYVNTTGTWKATYPYANLSSSFAPTWRIQTGNMQATKKFAMGGGPVIMTGGELQFTDTTTTPAIIGSIKSLSTAGATVKPRIILGA